MAFASAGLVAVAVPATARAQAGGINPGSPLPGVTRPAPPAVAPAAPAPPVAPAPVAAGQVFPIRTATILGATAYSPAELAPYLEGLTGTAVPLEKIEAARAALLTRYRRDGYTYTVVRVRLKDGALRMTVIEPHIVGVKLSKDIGPAGTQVLRFLNHLSDGRLLTAPELERWVLLANDVPGVTVQAQLSASPTDPGALTLVAVVSRQKFSGRLQADNRAFRLTGPEELLAIADANSFTSLGEQTEVSLYHTFNNTDTFGQASESFFIGGSGLRVRVYGGAGESIPSGSLRELGYDGVTRVAGISLDYPLIRSRAQDLRLAAVFDVIESDIAYAVQGGTKRASFDSLRVLRADVADTYSDMLFANLFDRAGGGNVTLGRFTLSQGLPILGAGSNGNKQLPRLNERIDFTKISAMADRTQFLLSPYAVGDIPARVQLEMALTGQYSGNVLPPEEKFYLGGPQFNRGFYYGEVTGDSALSFKVEPQLVTALPRIPWRGPWQNTVPQATLYGFFDWGQTWESQSLDKDHILRSLGGGVRLQATEHVEIDLEGVSRLTRTPQGAPPNGRRLKSSAFYWQVLAKF